MEYINNLDDIQSHKLIFKNPIKNQNAKYLYYYKLLYSDIDVHFKYILIPIKLSPHNKNIICEKIRNIEHLILSSLNQHVNKEIKMSLYTDLTSKEPLYGANHYQNLHLKISGIWENKEQIGLVYKLYYAMSTVKFSNMIC